MPKQVKEFEKLTGMQRLRYKYFQGRFKEVKVHLDRSTIVRLSKCAAALGLDRPTKKTWASSDVYSKVITYLAFSGNDISEFVDPPKYPLSTGSSVELYRIHKMVINLLAQEPKIDDGRKKAPSKHTLSEATIFLNAFQIRPPKDFRKGRIEEAPSSWSIEDVKEAKDIEEIKSILKVLNRPESATKQKTT